MVALATAASWTPEDDLLLKNAVEAGASLESLAKGAVQFSRRFTIREIQERWYSLLYDPIISEEASAWMNNVELSALSLPSKLSKFGPSKERKYSSLKRKAESVRNSYYAMRKRILNDAVNSMNLSFPTTLEHDDDAGIGVEPFSENCLPDGAAPNHYGFQGSNYDYVHCAFPENMMDGNLATSRATARTFYSDVDNPVGENFPIEQKNILKDEPQVLGDSMSFDGGVEEFGGPKELPVNSLMGDDSLASLPLSTFDQINSEPGNLCSEFDGNHVFNSPDLECGTSFNTSQLSSVPQLPMWRAGEGTQEPNVPCNALKNSVASGEAYLEELSNSLLNFTNEEELYLMDVDSKDGFDKSYYDGLSSLLLNSPDDVSPDQMSTITETEMPMASHSLNKNPSVSCHVEVDNKMVLSSSDLKATPKSNIQRPPYALAKDPRFPELTNGVIFCAFNTEDPEIPSNEDVFLPFKAPPVTLPSSFKQSSREANKPISSFVEDVGHSHRIEACRTLTTCGESHKSSHMVGSPPLPGPGTVSKVKCEFPNSHTSLPVSRGAVMDSSGSGEFPSARTSIKALVHANSKEKAADIDLAMHLDNDLANPFNETASHFSDDFRNYSHSNVSGKKMEHDLAMPVQDQRLLHAEMGPSVAESELVANPPTLDQEEQYIESDGDVPYYSDIEAMILDMDLDPDDQDLHYSEEVLKYQHEDAKRAIIRLEQSADSYMQRIIASQGALAILYDRNSKHYIKKPEVILGRATEDVPVDIDLGRGVNANKISRRQAIIKMDKVGSFYLKNLGKSSILVNNKEVHFGQSQQLSSSCLIEIRGVPFIFETNQSQVKQYLDSNGNTENNQTL
ncbi:hypothetical protein QN277_014672 [Acacia crassicarpa]|uniref:FHA domain-containing protein n=1 Tax=Acacia crassicarpa TaxID=499986 RepID=A0AAE1MTF3_9FABA|nr:hypothetical protein QN277_014672 [Acacia crassicarpa]